MSRSPRTRQKLANLPRPPKASERTANVSPLILLRSLTTLQWLLFLSGWLAWTCDAIDFFAVSLANTRLTKTFDKPTSTITTSITLTLLFRPLGAIIFGLASDRYGRKWPLIIDLICCGALSLGTSFCTNFGAFLGVRSLFGVAMGGIWGLSASQALESMPAEARGLFSGILQQGYAVSSFSLMSPRRVLATDDRRTLRPSQCQVGYLLAAVLNLTAVPDHDDWRILFWFGAGASFFAALIRLVLPESPYFLERHAAEKVSGSTVSSVDKSKIFIREAGRALKLHWVRCIFGLCLMTGFNFFSHGSQDAYPSYIQQSKGLTAHQATLATIIGNCGAIAGGTIAGYVSQYLGRRLTIIVCCLWTAVFIPLWLLPNSFGGLAAGAFFVQSGVQGAWGVVSLPFRHQERSKQETNTDDFRKQVPVYLAELSPVAFRAVWPGVAYQLGNMVSSASAQIETTAGSHIKTAEGRPDYGKVSAILIGVVAAWLIGCCLIGREFHGSHFEKGKAAFEQGGGKDEIEELDDDAISPRLTHTDAEKGFEKQEEQQRERASESDEKASTASFA
ncbi:SPOSA6832_01010, partial [Sporobolomyces salmonicolor]